MLHVTNGDYAADGIRALGLPGEVLPWRDVLHEGPVPAGLGLRELSAVRARFVAARGWASEEEAARQFAERDAALEAAGGHDEVVLWFEHDLYDQLQLVQLLDWLGARPLESTRLSLAGGDEYLGTASSDRLAEMFSERVPVSSAQLALARTAWEAFRAPDPAALEGVLAAGTEALPHLGPALRRHLEQFPGARDGLSRSERAALEEVAAGHDQIGRAYTASHHAREEAIFLGDVVFAGYLGELSDAERPLLVYADDGGTVRPPRASEDGPAFFARRVRLTEDGHDVLAGRADRVRINGIDRWLGGVHLSGHDVPWRWDAAARRVVRGGTGESFGASGQ